MLDVISVITSVEMGCTDLLLTINMHAYMHEKALKILEFHLINSSTYFDDQLYFDSILRCFFS